MINQDTINEIKSYSNINIIGQFEDDPEIIPNSVIDNTIHFIYLLSKINLIITPEYIYPFQGCIVIDIQNEKHLISCEIGQNKIGFFTNNLLLENYTIGSTYFDIKTSEIPYELKQEIIKYF